MHRALESTRRVTEQLNTGMGRAGSTSGRSFREMSRGAHNASSATSAAVKSVGALTAGVLTAAGAYKTLQATVGEAMKMENSQVVITAMLDDKSISKQYMKMMDSFAIKSPVLNTQDMYDNSKSFISQSKNIKQLEKMWNLTERLVAVDPAQGVSGAVLALKELMGGDSQSLVERFELPRKALNNIKNLPLDQQLAELDKLFNKMNMTNKLVKEMGGTSLGVINQIKEALAGKFRAVGFEALRSLKPVIVDLKNAVSDGALDGFFNSMGSAFAFLGSEASKFANYIKTNWPTIKANFDSTKTTLQPVGNALKLLYDGAKKAGDYILNNWNTVQETVIALGAAFVGYKIALQGALIVGTITKLMRDYQKVAATMTVAQWALNVAMDANPIGVVALAIGALIGAGVLLYRNWDTVKAKAQQLWTKFGSLITKILAFSGPIGGLIATGIKLCQNWDKVKAVGTSAFNAIGNVIDKVKGRFHAFTSAVASFKMPNFKAPSVASTKAGMGPSKSKSKKNKSSYHGESYVPRNGMMYRLHQGERVLTKKENRQYSKGSGKSLVVNLNGTTIREDADVDKLASALARKIYLAGEAGA
ncbi:hypothetical protein [Priestia megaterium]|uniref:hypothetical protein n=1 Tax=Priestia megaterium TaxID=1404 RepID=UPI0030090A85